MQKEVIFIKKKRKPLKIFAFSLLFVFLAGVLSAGTLAAALYVYMDNIDAELDVEMLAGNLGLTTKIYYTDKS